VISIELIGCYAWRDGSSAMCIQLLQQMRFSSLLRDFTVAAVIIAITAKAMIVAVVAAAA